MDKQYEQVINIYHDTRRIKNNNKYPVKLRIYCRKSKKTKYYKLNKEFSKPDFEHIWENGNVRKLRGKNKEVHLYFQAIEERAKEVAENINPFTFEKFEKKFFRKSTDGNNLIYHYEKTIRNSFNKGVINSSEGFKYSLQSIQKFIEFKLNKKLDVIPFDLITVEFLNDYEEYMLNAGKSVTTIGMYLRDLRRVFNYAIEEEDIPEHIYPFGKKGYQIPKSIKVKKTLNNNSLKILLNSEVRTVQQQKAKDFWFFSYCTSGMNIKDIAQLKYSDIKNDKVSYYRSKTFKRSIVKKKIEVYLNSHAKNIIKKYKTNEGNEFVFDIINSKDNDEEKHRKIKNFTRFLNQHLKKIAKDNNLDIDISSYWARHSFSTKIVREGKSMEFLSEALNHSDLKVTQSYFDGFEDDDKKQVSDNLMNF